MFALEFQNISTEAEASVGLDPGPCSETRFKKKKSNGYVVFRQRSRRCSSLRTCKAHEQSERSAFFIDIRAGLPGSKVLKCGFPRVANRASVTATKSDFHESSQLRLS